MEECGAVGKGGAEISHQSLQKVTLWNYSDCHNMILGRISWLGRFWIGTMEFHVFKMMSSRPR